MSVLVIGADGFVGGLLADALGAGRVVFRTPRQGERSASELDPLLRSAACVVNAAGFPGRPGLDLASYRESHAGLTRRIGALLSPGARLVHLSSASVLGRGAPLASGAAPEPERFALPSYARAKLEAEELARGLANERGFTVAVLRPAVVYGPGAHGLPSRAARLARRGILFDLRPHSLRHHFCSWRLLAECVRRVAAPGAPAGEPYLVADPFVVRQDELAGRLRALAGRRLVPLPIPAQIVGSLLSFAPASRNPRLDVRARGEFLRAFAADTVYQPDVFERLMFDEAPFGAASTFEPYLRDVFEKG